MLVEDSEGKVSLAGLLGVTTIPFGISGEVSEGKGGRGRSRSAGVGGCDFSVNIMGIVGEGFRFMEDFRGGSDDTGLTARGGGFEGTRKVSRSLAVRENVRTFGVKVSD